MELPVQGHQPKKPERATGCVLESVRIIRKRILLVEDDVQVRESIRLLLSIDRHIVVEAKTGTEALLLFTGESFDLVITDYLLPEMHGHDLAVSIKNIACLQPILMVSGYIEMLGHCKQSVDAILRKPFSIHELRQAINKLLS